MQLLIVRHAESLNNRLATDLSYDDYMSNRSADPPITELGEKQACLVAKHLADGTHAERLREPFENNAYGITHLYCSAMLRTLQTAKPIAEALNILPEIWIDMHEHGGMFLGNPRQQSNMQIFPGLSRAEIQDKFPGYVIPDTIQEQGWWQGGYEDMPACYARAIRVARDLKRRAEANFQNGLEERIGIVSHGTFIDSLLKAFLNQVPSRHYFYQHYNTAITRLDFLQDGTVLLRFVNRTQHLPPDLISA